MTQQPLEYLHISVLRQFLRHEFAELLEPKAAYPDVEMPAAGMPVEEDQEGPDIHSAAAADAALTAFDFERLLEDFVLLTFLVSPAAWNIQTSFSPFHRKVATSSWQVTCRESACQFQAGPFASKSFEFCTSLCGSCQPFLHDIFSSATVDVCRVPMRRPAMTFCQTCPRWTSTTIPRARWTPSWRPTRLCFPAAATSQTAPSSMLAACGHS